MNNTEVMEVRKKTTEFRLQILVSIYMACKANQIRKVAAPNGTNYCVSFNANTLVISSKTDDYSIDANQIHFLESKIGKSSKCFVKSSDVNTRKPIFFVVWENFDIDKI